MTSSLRTQISDVVASIRSLESTLKPLAEDYAVKVRSFPADKRVPYTKEYWQALSMYDSLTRVRNFIENNFMVVETLGVLSLARYTLELVIQLKRIDLDPIFAIVYAREILEQQVEHHKKMAEHLRREIALYRQLGERETSERRDALAATLATTKAGSKESLGERVAEALRAASSAIDEELATSLTLYSEDAKTYGFAFQAHRIETQALPQLVAAAEENERSLTELNEVWGEVLANSKYMVNKWNRRAEQVSMKSEYEFIYSYTSRLLHATPVSISTSQQCLQDAEILLFYKYVYAEFLWIIRRAEKNKMTSIVH